MQLYLTDVYESPSSSPIRSYNHCSLWSKLRAYSTRHKTTSTLSTEGCSEPMHIAKTTHLAPFTVVAKALCPRYVTIRNLIRVGTNIEGIQALRDVLAAAERAVKGCTNTTDCSDLIPVELIQQSILAKLFGQPDFPNISESLRDALDGNYTLLLGGQGPPTVESVVALPLECGDIGNCGPILLRAAVGLTRSLSRLQSTQLLRLPTVFGGWTGSKRPYSS